MSIQNDADFDNIEEHKDLDEMSEEEYKQFEGSIVDALLESSKYKDDAKNERLIKIVRNKILMFSFKIHPLNESDFQRARRQNTKHRNGKDEELDVVRYRSNIIFMATCEDDRKKLWNNKDIWIPLNVASGVDAINEILKPGEKAKIIDVIEGISGYNDDIDETMGNS